MPGDDTRPIPRQSPASPATSPSHREEVPEPAADGGSAADDENREYASSAADSPISRLASALFAEPVPVPRGSTDGRRTTAVGGLAGPVLAVAAAVFALRLPVPRWDALWAEDGTEFLQSALQHPWWEALFQPYAGYVNVFPRLCGQVAAALPLGWSPFVFVAMAALLVGTVCAAIWQLSAAHVPSTGLRLLLIAAVVLVPGGGLEAVGNVSNSHSYLLLGALWALLGRPRGSWLLVTANALIALSALSDPTTIVLAPLALARLLAVRNVRERSVVITYAVTIALQMAAVLSAERPPGEPADVGRAVFGYIYRVVTPTFLGLDRSHDVAETARGAITLVGVATLVLLAASLVLARRQRLLVLAMATASMAFFAVPCLFPLAGATFPPTGAQELDLHLGGRYTIVPSVLLVTCLIVTAQALTDRLPRPTAALVVLVAAIPVLTWAAVDYRPAPLLRTAVDPWTTSLRALRSDCDADPLTPPRLLPVEPGGGPWAVTVTCAQAGR